MIDDKLYTMHYTHDESVNVDSFKLHSHDSRYELLIFFSTKAEYISEGTVYELNTNDLVIARPNEMHRIKHLSNTNYSRFCINISKDFFKEYNCECYEDFFWKYDLGTYNKINGDSVIESGIYDVFLRMKKYSGDFKNIYTPVIVGCILEILHILNSNEDIFEIVGQTNLVRNIISYINSNFKTKINLDILAGRHFVSKYYLCRIFKAKTGYTVTGYINHKRIINVKELCRQGMSISQASLESGFGNYLTFYKAYLKETGKPPKNILKNQ